MISRRYWSGAAVAALVFPSFIRARQTTAERIPDVSNETRAYKSILDFLDKYLKG